MTLGERLLELRRKNAMSQDTLAEKLEVSRQAVSKWERDEAVPETDKIVKIAQLFDVSTDSLLMDSEEKTAQAQTESRPFQTPRAAQRPQMQRLEMFLRRHGYKGGFVLVGVGVLTDAICLGFRAFWRNAVSGMGSVGNHMGDSFIPGFGMGDELFHSFEQSTQKMNEAASSWGDIFLLGMIPGTALILLGLYVIIKGRKLARKTEKE